MCPGPSRTSSGPADPSTLIGLPTPRYRSSRSPSADRGGAARLALSGDQPDAAQARLRIESDRGVRETQPGDHSPHEVEVHAADEVGVVLGQRVEGAVAQRQPGGIEARLEALR